MSADSTKYQIDVNPVTCEIIYRLSVLFDNNHSMTRAWIFTKNLNFGNAAPVHLIQSGRADKVLAFIKDRSRTLSKNNEVNP